MEQYRAFGREHGYVETIFGRKVWLPQIKSPNGAERSFGERQAINAPLQGSAADIIKRAMIRMPQALKDAGLKAKMLLQVHDELVFECPEKEAKNACRGRDEDHVRCAPARRAAERAAGGGSEVSEVVGGGALVPLTASDLRFIALAFDEATPLARTGRPAHRLGARARRTADRLGSQPARPAGRPDRAWRDGLPAQGGAAARPIATRRSTPRCRPA